MLRQQIADHVVYRLQVEEAAVSKAWRHAAPVPYFAVDHVLPEALALRIRQAFPEASTMRTRRSLRELKYVSAQMDAYDPLLEEVLFAFQDSRVVELVGRITGLCELKPDELLYAGGISMMSQGHFLNPHIDNSHDKARDHYRVLNLLYYASPNWSIEKGGNLELWPEGVEGSQITVESRFNRLVVMLTNRRSWHSVSPVNVAEQRCCISNYYFSPLPADTEEYFHVTSFRGRPEQRMRDLVLRADAMLRMGIRKLFPAGAVQTTHFYAKKDRQ